MKLFMLRGLPASGKTTKRLEMLADPALAPITAINKDDIRRELGIHPGDFEREKEVKSLEKYRTHDALKAGISVIIDNTHNSPKYQRYYEDMAAQYGCDFELIDLKVPVEECIRRDALRPPGVKVGEAIIRRMYEQFYR